MLDALFVGLAIFAALEAHSWRNRRREKPEETKSLGEMVRSVLPQEKAEFLLPMTPEEYDAHMEAKTSRGELMAKLTKPWKSPSPKSPSSGS